MNTQDAKRVLETALICASQPLTLREMRSLFADELGADTLRSLLDELTRDWDGRGVELVALASGWRFQSRPEVLVPAGVLLIDHGLDPATHIVEGRAGRPSVHTALDHIAFDLLFEPGNSHLEEFVQV